MIANQTEADLRTLLAARIVSTPMLAGLGGLTGEAGKVIRFTGSYAAELVALSNYIAALLGSSDAAATLAALGLPQGLIAPQAYDAYGTGSAYSLTATSALLSLGTTMPTITLAVAGAYRLTGRAVVTFSGATFLASRTVTVKMRRINNTAADLTNGGVDLPTGILSLVTGPLAILPTPDVIYTATAGDQIQLFGSVSVLPTAGNLLVTAASIHAQRIA